MRRMACVTIILVALLTAPVYAVQIYDILSAPQPRLVLMPSGNSYMVTDFDIQLPAGTSELAYDFSAFDVDEENVRLRLISPDDATIGERYRSPQKPGTVCWTIESPRAQQGTVQLRYVPSGLDISFSYDAKLRTDDGHLQLNAHVTVKNDSAHDYRSLQIRTATGDRFAVSLDSGASITRKLGACDPAQYQSEFVYDTKRYGDHVTQVISFVPVERTSLSPGSIRFVIDADGLQQVLGTAQLPYVRRGEEVTLSVRKCTAVAVSGGLEKSEQKSVRTDVYKKLALYDQQEQSKFELYNNGSDDIILRFYVHHEGDWELKDCSHEFSREDAEVAVFRVPIGAGDKTVLKYTVVTHNLTP
ncbi:MAG: hypothetical protein R6V19_06570 [Armatimonadota bacterium]